MNRNYLIRTLALMAGILTLNSAYATNQDSASFTVNPAQTLVGTSGTLQTKTFTVTGYVLGRIDYTGDTTEINGTTSDYGSENSCLVVFPGGAASTDFTLTSVGAYSGTLTFSGSFFLSPGATTPFSGAWSFYFRNTFDDTPTGQPDSLVHATFTLTDVPPTPPTAIATYNPLANGTTSSLQSYTAGLVRWYKVVIPTATSLTRYLDIDTENTTVAGTATSIALYDSSGNLLNSDSTDGSGSLSQLSFGGNANPRPAVSTGGNPIGALYDGRDGNISAGTYYVGVTRSAATWQPTWTASSTSTGTANVNLRLSYNAVPGVPTPPSATNLGALPIGTTSTSFNHGASQVTWFSFTLGTPISATRFLDIDMNGSNQDYDLALYDSGGNPLSYADGKVPFWEPALSYGGESVPRSALPNTYAFAGQSGELPAGTYYLAVARWELKAGQYFQATSTGASTGSNVPLHLVLGNVTVPSQILYNQPLSALNKVPDTFLNMSSVLGSIAGTDQSDRMVADDFVVPSPGWDVNLIEGSFIRASDSTTAPTAVTVSLFQKAGSLPGALVFSQTGSYSVTNGGYVGVSTSVQRYRIPISQFHLAAGSYFVLVQPSSGFNNFWMAGTGLVNSPAVFKKGPSSTGTTDDGYTATWTALGTANSIFLVPMDLAFKIEGSVSSPNIVSGIVDFGNLGAGYNSGPLPSTVPVEFRDAANAFVASGVATYNPVTGAFAADVPDSVVGPYRVSFKLGFWLRKTLPNPADPAAPLGNFGFGLVTPIVGDADLDNEITNSDYALWAASNGNSVSANTGSDFDGDGEITNSDYALWAANNGSAGDN